MKTIFLKYAVVFLIFLAQSLIAQKKPHVYFNSDGEKVKESDYCRRCEIQYFVPIEVENDSTIEHRIVPRQIMGVLNETELAQAKQMIEATVGDKINSNNIIILNFFRKTRNNVKWYSKDKRYIKQCEKKEAISQFFITEKGFQFKSKNTTIFEDSSGNIGRIFFTNSSINCGYAIIKPDGYYYLYLGEYQQSKILDIAQSSWDIETEG